MTSLCLIGLTLSHTFLSSMPSTYTPCDLIYVVPVLIGRLGLVLAIRCFARFGSVCRPVLHDFKTFSERKTFCNQDDVDECIVRIINGAGFRPRPVAITVLD